MQYEQGDILFLDFDPSVGHEPAKRHPVIVISCTMVNFMTSQILLAPVTSTDNHFPLHVKIAEGNAVSGFVQLEAMRALDLGNRYGVERAGSLDDDTLSAVLEAAGAVLGI